jgi:DNA-binding Lrp family transcriptional regulator
MEAVYGDLDATDRRLISLLQENARRSVAELGRMLNLSRTAVQARLARLERDGVVVGYTAILRKPAADGVSALLSLRFDVRPCSLVLDQIKSWPEILTGYSTAGPIDAVLVVRVSSTSALSSLTDKLATVPGIEGVETTVIVDSFADRRG